jgi:hypothetical protein
MLTALLAGPVIEPEEMARLSADLQGRSWASYLGAVGILYEMGRASGTLVKQPSGIVRTYAETVEHQLASSIANLETLSANRAALLRGMLEARKDAIRRGTEGPVRAWLLPPNRLVSTGTLVAAMLVWMVLNVAPASWLYWTS